MSATASTSRSKLTVEEVADMLRSLLPEGRVRYETVEKTGEEFTWPRDGVRGTSPEALRPEEALRLQ